MTDIPHFGFILAAYAVTGFVLLGTVAAVIIDGRAQRRLLGRLESQGSPRGRRDAGGA